MLSHLKECGDIEQDADAVLFINEEDGAYRLIVAKHRHGRRGFVEVDFDGQKTRFSDASVIKVGGTNRWPK